MTKEKKESGLKSAFELAMDRMGHQESALTLDQKEALAEIDRETEAKIAEVQIMTGQRLAEARGKGDAQAIGELEAGRTSEIEGIKAAAEEKKNKIRERET